MVKAFAETSGSIRRPGYITDFTMVIKGGLGMGPLSSRCSTYSTPGPSGYRTSLWNRIPRRRITAIDAAFSPSAPEQSFRPEIAYARIGNVN